MNGERGSALLLVVGATAAIAALTLAALSAALISYEIAIAEQDGVSAELLADSALALFATAVDRGEVGLAPVAGETTWQPPMPAPPPGFSPLPADCRLLVRVSAVGDATGFREWELGGAGSMIFDAIAEAHCGRGLARRRARFARVADGEVFRLY